MAHDDFNLHDRLATADAIESDATDESAAAAPSIKPLRWVLLVEDEQPFRELLQAFLESEGFKVHAVQDGRYGATWLESNSADIVITDLCMPEVDGMEFLIAMRKMRSAIPVIAMSGGVAGDMAGMLRAAGLLGACCALAKPFSLNQLAMAVRDALASGESSLTQTSRR